MRTFILIAMATLACAGSRDAAGQSLPAEQLIDELVLAAAGGVSLDEAVAMAEKRFRARVVRAEVKEKDGRRIYELRLLSDESGRVWKVRVDAATGSVL